MVCSNRNKDVSNNNKKQKTKQGVDERREKTARDSYESALRIHIGSTDRQIGTELHARAHIPAEASDRMRKHGTRNVVDQNPTASLDCRVACLRSIMTLGAGCSYYFYNGLELVPLDVVFRLEEV